MKITAKRRIIVIPLMIIILASMLCISVSAVKCFDCGNNSIATCTGQDVSYYASHYQYLFFNKCEYYNQCHWVNTSCCGRDLGNHLYADTIHPAAWCGQIDPAFPCSDVPSWDY